VVLFQVLNECFESIANGILLENTDIDTILQILDQVVHQLLNDENGAELLRQFRDISFPKCENQAV